MAKGRFVRARIWEASMKCLDINNQAKIGRHEPQYNKSIVFISCGSVLHLRRYCCSATPQSGETQTLLNNSLAF